MSMSCNSTNELAYQSVNTAAWDDYDCSWFQSAYILASQLGAA